VGAEVLGLFAWVGTLPLQMGATDAHNKSVLFLLIPPQPPPLQGRTLLNSDAEQDPPQRPAKKTLIGWTEYVDLVEWDIRGLRAKVDTGARTSALHVENLRLLPSGQARFEVVLSRRHTHRRVWITAPVLKWARVRSSTGAYTLRCFVLTTIKIGAIEKQIEVSLVSRGDMLFRMLLGRKALERDFVIDVSRRHVLGRHPAKKGKNPRP
jgi:hypothetical protein